MKTIIFKFLKTNEGINYALLLLILGILIRAFYQEKYTVMLFQHDWHGHIEMIKHIANTWTLPVPTKGLEFPQQPFYYFLTAGIYSLSTQLGFSEKISLEIIGYFSFFCSVLFLIYGYKFIALLTNDRHIKSIAMVFLALTPSLVYLSARISNDTLVMALSAISLYYMVKSYQNQFKEYFHIALISVTLLFLSKISTAGIELLFFALILLVYKNSKSQEIRHIQNRLYLFSLLGMFSVSFTLWKVYMPMDGLFYMVNSSGHYPGQRIENLNLNYFIGFNFMSLFQAGQSHIFGEDSIRYSFITYQYGTMFFGEFDYAYFTNKIPWLKEVMQSILLFGLIFLLGLLSYIINIYKASGLKKLLFLTLLINLLLILKFMFNFPSICNTDFRYFVSSFLIFAFIFAQGLSYIRQCKRLSPIIDGLLILLVLSEITFFIGLILQ